jgi:hypothetical protein
LLLEVSWDYTTPIGGEFFFPPSQRGQFGQDMASRVLIGFLNITGSHMPNHNFCSLTGLAPSSRFLSSTHLQLLLKPFISHGFPFFSASVFLPGRQFAFYLHISKAKVANEWRKEIGC